MSDEINVEAPIAGESNVEAPRTGQPKAKGCLPGCLIIVAIIVVALIGIGLWFRAYLLPRMLFKDYFKGFITFFINNIEIPKETKNGTNAALNEMAKYVENKEKIKEINKGLGRILQRNVTHAMLCSFIEARVDESSQLKANERERLYESLRIFYKALSKNKISEKDNRAISDTMPRSKSGMLKTKWTDEEIRKVMEKISEVIKKSAADITGDDVDYKAPILEAADQIIKLGHRISGKPQKPPATQPASPKAPVPAEKPAPATKAAPANK